MSESASKLLKWIEAFILTLWAIFAPIHTVLVATGVLILLDLFTSVLGAIKRKEPITNARFTNTITKLLIYEIAMCAAFIAESYISDTLPFGKMVSSVVSILTLRSVFENLQNWTDTDLLKVLIVKLEPPKDPGEKS